MMTIEVIIKSLSSQRILLPENLIYSLRLILAARDTLLRLRNTPSGNPELYLYGEYLNHQAAYLITQVPPQAGLELRVGLVATTAACEGIKTFIANSFKASNRDAKIELRADALCFYFSGSSFLINLFEPGEFKEGLALALVAKENPENIYFPHYNQAGILNNGFIEALLEKNNPPAQQEEIAAQPEEPILVNHSQQQQVTLEKLVATENNPLEKNVDNTEQTATKRKTRSKNKKMLQDNAKQEERQADPPAEQKAQQQIERQTVFNKAAPIFNKPKNNIPKQEKNPKKEHVATPRFQSPPPPPSLWQKAWNATSNIISWCVKTTINSVKLGYRSLWPRAVKNRGINSQTRDYILEMQGRLPKKTPALIAIPQSPPLIAQEDLWKFLKLIFQFSTELEATTVLIDKTRRLPGQARVLHVIFACLLTYYFDSSPSIQGMLVKASGFVLIDNALALLLKTRNQSQKNNPRRYPRVQQQNVNKTQERPDSFFFQTAKKISTSAVQDAYRLPQQRQHEPSTLGSYLRPVYGTRLLINYITYLSFFGLPRNEQLLNHSVILTFWAALNAISDNHFASAIIAQQNAVQQNTSNITHQANAVNNNAGIANNFFTGFNLLARQAHRIEISERDEPSQQRTLQLRMSHIFLATYFLWYFQFELTPFNLFLAAWALDLLDNLGAALIAPQQNSSSQTASVTDSAPFWARTAMNEAIRPRQQRWAEPGSFASYFRPAYLLQFLLLLFAASFVLLRNAAPEKHAEIFEQIMELLSAATWINMVLDNRLGANRAAALSENQAASENRITEIIAPKESGKEEQGPKMA